MLLHFMSYCTSAQFQHGVIDRVHVWSNVAQKMILTVRTGTAYPLKLRLGLISKPVYDLNL